MLRFYNTMSRKLEPFVPLDKNKVRMYTCGPTVYNYAHIGNFRAYVWEDLLRRYLQYKGFEVLHVMNFTDVDDKTIRNSVEKNMPLREYTDIYKRAFIDDITALNILPAHVYPAATEHIKEMVSMIETLLAKGYAYKTDDGNIYFSIAKFENYGALSGKKPEQLLEGARISHDEYEKGSWADFALWKSWDEHDGDVFWNTSIGKGRPGWHIECSAMSAKYLGETFDIHTGGEDNIFPHHENEIAQSQAATGKSFARFWMHCAHLIVEGKKMSKSMGNFFTLRDLITKGYSPISIRYLLLSTHYRQQLNFTFEGIEAAGAAIDRLVEFRLMLEDFAKNKNIAGTDAKVTSLYEGLEKNFDESMDDDLNISGALGHVFENIRAINRIAATDGITVADAEQGLSLLTRLDLVLGIFPSSERALTDEMKALIAVREAARASKNWAAADTLRNQLEALGLEIKDSPDGTKWRFK